MPEISVWRCSMHRMAAPGDSVPPEVFKTDPQEGTEGIELIRGCKGIRSHLGGVNHCALAHGPAAHGRDPWGKPGSIPSSSCASTNRNDLPTGDGFVQRRNGPWLSRGKRENDRRRNSSHALRC